MYKIYCDFDATVTLNDVWHELFKRFGKPEAFTIWNEFNAGRMRASDCIRYACSTVQNADLEKAEQLFREQPLREGFVEFAKFCEERGIELRIVSDGFSGYIRPVLDAHGLSHIPFWTNTVEFTPGGSLSTEFPHERESCSACACCKCGQLLVSSADEDTTVYIGDGYSDVCPVRMADIVFARDHLLTYCSANGIPHHPFTNFITVRQIIEKYLRERPKYRREQAHRRRKELIMME